MIREIKFRAKIVMDTLTLKKGDWIEGYYCEDLHQGEWCSWIQEYNDITHYKVDKNTLCQFTGWFDKNCKEIWEHDIVDWNGVKLFVKFINGGFCMFENYEGAPLHDLFFEWDEINVIGNIFDNPELFKVKTL